MNYSEFENVLGTLSSVMTLLVSGCSVQLLMVALARALQLMLGFR